MSIKLKKCKFCKGPIKKPKKAHLYDRMVFCSVPCKYNSHLEYERLRYKSDPELREHKKLALKRWIGNNREHFKEMMRPISRKYMAKVHKDRIDSGKCYGCGKKRDKNFKSCIPCRTISRKGYYTYKKEKKWR